MKSLIVTPHVIFIVGVIAVVASAWWQQPATDRAASQIFWATLSFGLYVLVTSVLLLVRSKTDWSRDKIEDMLFGIKYAGAPWLAMGSLSSLLTNGINLPDILGVIVGALVLGWIEIYVKDELKLLDQRDLWALRRKYISN